MTMIHLQGWKESSVNWIEKGTLPNDSEIKQFRYLFPCPEESVRSELEKHIDTARTKQKAKELQRSWSVTKETMVEEVYKQPVETLVRVLKQFCDCKSKTCTLRSTRVKYDLVCRIMEHARNMKIMITKDVEKMSADELKSGLRQKNLPISGSKTEDILKLPYCILLLLCAKKQNVGRIGRQNDYFNVYSRSAVQP